MGQLWVTGNQGQLLYSPLLSKESMHAAQPKMRFLQYCDIKEEFGKQSGETFLFTVYSDIDTQGGVLTETATIPLNSYTIVRGTGTLNELGKCIAPLSFCLN